MSQKILTTLMLAVVVCLSTPDLHAQYNFQLVEVNHPPKGEPEITFGSLMNIKVKYQLTDSSTREQALEELKKYYLVINGKGYPSKNIGSMQLMNHTDDSVRRDSIMPKGDTTKKAVITTTSFHSFEFQTVVDPSHSDTNNKNTLSAFWTDQYIPLSSKAKLTITLLAPGVESQSVDGNTSVTLRFYETKWVWIFIVFFLAILTLTLVKASKDNFSLLRDDTGGCDVKGKVNPFSLSRLQVLLWTFVILWLAAYQWAVTGFFPAITSAHLILLGIAAGQRIMAQIIDTPGGAEKQPGLTLAADGANAKCSVGFFTDIISDQTGLSISRLQYVIITFIYLVMFISSGIQKLELMDFSLEQLALMGTSAGLYLWDKQLNKKAATPNPVPPPPPPPAGAPVPVPVNPGQGGDGK
jgi:hypothetical protein